MGTHWHWPVTLSNQELLLFSRLLSMTRHAQPRSKQSKVKAEIDKKISVFSSQLPCKFFSIKIYWVMRGSIKTWKRRSSDSDSDSIGCPIVRSTTGLVAVVDDAEPSFGGCPKRVNSEEKKHK